MNNSEMDRINETGEFELSFNRFNDNNKPAGQLSPPESKPARVLTRSSGMKFVGTQIRAILYKNLAFQKRQIAMNVFQILSPLICIFLIWLAQYEMKTLFQEDYSFNKIHGIPFFFNLPTSFFSQSAAYPISSSDCLKWFLYQDARKKNTQNLPIENLMRPQFFEYCRRIDKLVPVFNKTDGNVNDEIYNELNYLDRYPLYLGEEIEGLDRIPDAGLVFNEYRSDSLNVDIQINDLLFNEFHRDNGFSKLSFKMPSSGFNFFKELRDDYFPNATNAKSLDQGFQKLKQYFTGNTTIDETIVTQGSQQILNKTQSALKRLMANRNTTFPVI